MAKKEEFEFEITKPEEVSNKNGDLKIKYDKELVKKNLPEDLPEKTVKRAMNYISAFNKAITEDAVEYSKKAFKKDKDVKRVIATAQAGMDYRDKLTVNVYKEKEFPSGKNDGKRVKTPYVNSKYTGSILPSKTEMKKLVDDYLR